MLKIRAINKKDFFISLPVILLYLTTLYEGQTIESITVFMIT